MKKNGLFEELDQGDIGLLIQRFDKDGDGKICLKEWKELIAP